MTDQSKAEVWVIVVAGGSGRRYGGLKQFELLVGDERVIDRSVAVAASIADGVVVVLPPEQIADERSTWSARVDAGTAVLGIAAGGETRAASVRAGLAEVPATATVICVHDAARPLASVDLYQRVITTVLEGTDGVVPGVAVVDTIKVVDGDGVVVDTPPRDSLVAVQTPQGFRADVLRRAHADNSDGSDDAVLVESVGGRVVVIAGEDANLKITQPIDVETVRRQLT